MYGAALSLVPASSQKAPRGLTGALCCSDISQSDGVVVDGITMRNTWWWNTEVEHSTHVTIQNYKIPNVSQLVHKPRAAARSSDC